MSRSSFSVLIALGSNLGDRALFLRRAIHELRGAVDVVRVSSFIETEPVDAPPGSPRFLNAVVAGATHLAPQPLLDALLAIEDERGRERPYPNAPRTLDLDLILYGDSVIEEPGLLVPHPRFRERRFVLEPLAEVAAELRDPVTGKTADQLLADLPGRAR